MPPDTGSDRQAPANDEAPISGAPSDGLPAEPEHCPVCDQDFDPTDLAAVLRHVH